MSVRLGLALATLAAALALPTPAGAQIGLGAHYAQFGEAFGGAVGAGARVTLGLPFIPITAAVNGEYFFPRCGSGDCALHGATFDVNVSLPFIALHPWAGIGWSVRRLEVGKVERTERGLNFGVGAELGLGGFRPFVDLRYELANAPEDQLLARFGLMFR